jgi:hypothetical protein
VTEPAPDNPHAGTMVEPREPDTELSRKNLMWGLALFGIALVLAGGTIVVALIYNAVADY